MKNFKTIYLYRDSDLPEEGWQHPCFLCYTITGNEVDYKMVEKTDIFLVYGGLLLWLNFGTIDSTFIRASYYFFIPIMYFNWDRIITGWTGTKHLAYLFLVFQAIAMIYTKGDFSNGNLLNYQTWLFLN